jgi:hypothetical protein
LLALHFKVLSLTLQATRRFLRALVAIIIREFALTQAGVLRGLVARQPVTQIFIVTQRMFLKLMTL